MTAGSLLKQRLQRIAANPLLSARACVAVLLALGTLGFLAVPLASKSFREEEHALLIGCAEPRIG